MRFLIVDDSRAMRTFVRGAIQNAYQGEVVEVESGFEALKLLSREPFNIIITDINMADINGIELMRFIRSSERHADTPVVVITTQATEQTREKIANFNHLKLVPKPFDPETLINAIEQLLTSESKSESTDLK